MPTIFLNTDLVLDSAEPLSDLAQALGEDISVLFCDCYLDGYRAVLEVGASWESPAETIAAFCERIEALSPVSRSAWAACTARELDIGFEARTGGPSHESVICNDTLVRMAQLGIAIRITIHPPIEGEESA